MRSLDFEWGGFGNPLVLGNCFLEFSHMYSGSVFIWRRGSKANPRYLLEMIFGHPGFGSSLGA